MIIGNRILPRKIWDSYHNYVIKDHDQIKLGFRKVNFLYFRNENGH